MKRLTIIATVLLAASGLASAQPDAYQRGYDDGYDACTAGAQYATPPGARDYRRGYSQGYRACTLGPAGTENSEGQYEAPRGLTDYTGWAVLGAGSLAGPSGKLLVGKQAGRFSRVRIEATAGAPFIRSVDVRLLDNSLQSFAVDRRLRPGEVLELDLGGAQPISSITVSGQPDPAAQYQLSAR